MPLRPPRFWLKVGLALALAGLADGVLFERDPGLNVGLVSLGLHVAVGLTNPAIWRCRTSVFAVFAALGFGLLQIERPTALGWVLYALAVGVAVLAPRAATGEDAFQWAQRLVAGGVLGAFGPVLDAGRLRKARARSRSLRLAALAGAAALPVVGGVIFLSLFAVANPVISEALAGFRLPAPDAARILFAGVVATVAWTALRPRGLRRRAARAGTAQPAELPGATTLSVAASLVVFNLVFALQNGLDLAFLWSGATLPQGMSHAEYAHRGAYPLIATALLAGLFVLVFLRPGTPTAASRPIRRLVTVWVAQNVFLVASTMLRTLEYVDAYSLTRLRIAALIWMILVAVGLVLIAWRLVRGRSGGWLMNANALAAGVALAACSLVDLGAVAAAWNVHHAREVGGRGVALDLAYIGRLSGAGVVSLAELEQRPLDPVFRCKLSRTRRWEMAWMSVRQADWRAWRWRDARRLRRVETLTGERPMSVRAAGRLTCPGDVPSRPAPLTPPANPRS